MWVCVCVWKKERSTERQIAHCITAYLRHKQFVMLCWGLCSINGSAYRFKLQIWSAESSLLSLRLTHNNNEKSAGNRLGREFSWPYPAHKRYMAWAAIPSMADSTVHGLQTQSEMLVYKYNTDKATRQCWAVFTKYLQRRSCIMCAKTATVHRSVFPHGAQVLTGDLSMVL